VTSGGNIEETDFHFHFNIYGAFLHMLSDLY